MKSRMKEFMVNWRYSNWIVKIPLALALDVWHLTFSLALPLPPNRPRAWTQSGLALFFFFFLVKETKRNMPSLFPWWLGLQQIPKGTVITIICDRAVDGLFVRDLCAL